MPNSSSTKHVATLYRFCAQSMHYPQPEWFNSRYFDSFKLLLETLGAKTELKFISEFLESSPDYLEEMQVEHTRLFINGVPHVAAPPYGSVYQDKSLMGKFAEELLSFYHEKGYSLTEEADLADNIIHQLEFLALLAEDQNQEAEREFLQRFFLPWFKDFAELVIDEAEYPFYPIIISLIDFFTKEEEAYGV